MKTIDRPVCIFTACAIALCLGSCSELFMKDPPGCSYTTMPYEELPMIEMEDAVGETPGNYPNSQCIRTEYYLCPGISGPLMRIEIVKDVCKDPPVVLSMSECEEFLECNPSFSVIDEEPCTTLEGYPGTRLVYCDKGFIKPGTCIGKCTDDVCDDEKENKEEEKDVSPDKTGLEVGQCKDDLVDILFLVDMSASMKNEIDEVIDAINFFAFQYKNDSILWSMIAGPLNAGETPGNQNYLAMISNLQHVDDFKKDVQIITTYDLNSQYEMLYDALYLSIKNISLFLPYENDVLVWPTWIGNVFAESDPPLGSFEVSWRKNSKKVIIVFTNEIGQSFLFPLSKKGKTYNTKETITKSKLSLMLQTISSIRVYTFTDEGSKTGIAGWSHFSQITGGEWNMLFDGDIKANLSNIVEDNLCP